MEIKNAKKSPKFVEFGTFFRLLHDLDIEILSQLESDPFAARYLARFGSNSCTIRLRRDDVSCTNDTLYMAWELETNNAQKLLRKGNTITGLASVLRVAEQGRPGFVICDHFGSRTIDDIETNDIRLSLDVVLQITMSFMRLLEARANVGICALLPDAKTITVQGKDVKFLEPTAVHAGDLCPCELRELPVNKLKFVTRGELEMAWPFGAAALLTRLLSGKARQISYSSSKSLPQLQLCLVGAIDAAARLSEKNFPKASRSMLLEIVTHALGANESDRPPFNEFYGVLKKLAENGT